jgi:hypothetical protein
MRLDLASTNETTGTHFENFANLKVDILCNGVFYDDAFLAEYAQRDDLIGKRRAYGASDMANFGSRKVPQEILLDDGTIVAVNFRPRGRYTLVFREGTPYILSPVGTPYTVKFPKEPKSYDVELSNGQRFKEIATYYGNSTLGFFNPGHCYYFDDGTECRFCSLGPARAETNHVMKVMPKLADEVIGLSVKHDGDRIRRTLINGGNARNYDKGFQSQARLARVLSEANQKHTGGRLKRHLIAMPPKDHMVIEEIADTVDSLAMSLEIYDKDYFEQICPGKDQDYGRDHFIAAYDKAVEVLGPGNVYVGFVAGLEPIDTLIAGMNYFADRGVVPAIAVFHPGRGSKFEHVPTPRTSDMLEVGHEMQRLYTKYGYGAFIPESGRNSLDTEAQNARFT